MTCFRFAVFDGTGRLTSARENDASELAARSLFRGGVRTLRNLLLELPKSFCAQVRLHPSQPLEVTVEWYGLVEASGVARLLIDQEWVGYALVLSGANRTTDAAQVLVTRRLLAECLQVPEGCERQFDLEQLAYRPLVAVFLFRSMTPIEESVLGMTAAALGIAYLDIHLWRGALRANDEHPGSP